METIFIHPERCIGCKQCEAECAVAHSESKNLYWSVFESPAPKQRIHAEPGLLLATAFPNKCRHCNPAPCIAACPTAAIHRAADYPDIVLIDEKKCITCAMCAMVCPFDVITFHASSGAPGKAAVAIKCDHCIERQREGNLPACVQVCKVRALEFGEINELIKKARTEYAEAVSVAISQVGETIEPLPPAILGWQRWGASVSRLGTNGKKGA
jgi:carbon-monoxide dehydrogenase iron sulfur subunit